MALLHAFYKVKHVADRNVRATQDKENTLDILHLEEENIIRDGKCKTSNFIQEEPVWNCLHQIKLHMHQMCDFAMESH